MNVFGLYQGSTFSNYPKSHAVSVRDCFRRKEFPYNVLPGRLTITKIDSNSATDGDLSLHVYTGRNELLSFSGTNSKYINASCREFKFRG